MKNVLLLLMFSVCSMQAMAQAAAASPELSFSKMKRSDAATKTISINEILADPKFTFDQEGWRVTSFTFSLLPKKGDFWGPFTVNGAELSPRIKSEIKKFAGQGGKIYVEQIKVVGTDRRPRNWAAFIFNYTN